MEKTQQQSSLLEHAISHQALSSTQSITFDEQHQMNGKENDKPNQIWRVEPLVNLLSKNPPTPRIDISNQANTQDHVHHKPSDVEYPYFQLDQSDNDIMQKQVGQETTDSESKDTSVQMNQRNEIFNTSSKQSVPARSFMKPRIEKPVFSEDFISKDGEKVIRENKFECFDNILGDENDDIDSLNSLLATKSRDKPMTLAEFLKSTENVSLTLLRDRHNSESVPIAISSKDFKRNKLVPSIISKKSLSKLKWRDKSSLGGETDFDDHGSHGSCNENISKISKKPQSKSLFNIVKRRTKRESSVAKDLSTASPATSDNLYLSDTEIFKTSASLLKNDLSFDSSYQQIDLSSIFTKASSIATVNTEKTVEFDDSPVNPISSKLNEDIDYRPKIRKITSFYVKRPQRPSFQGNENNLSKSHSMSNLPAPALTTSNFALDGNISNSKLPNHDNAVDFNKEERETSINKGLDSVADLDMNLPKTSENENSTWNQDKFSNILVPQHHQHHIYNQSDNDKKIVTGHMKLPEANYLIPSGKNVFFSDITDVWKQYLIFTATHHDEEDLPTWEKYLKTYLPDVAICKCLQQREKTTANTGIQVGPSLRDRPSPRPRPKSLNIEDTSKMNTVDLVSLLCDVDEDFRKLALEMISLPTIREQQQLQSQKKFFVAQTQTDIYKESDYLDEGFKLNGRIPSDCKNNEKIAQLDTFNHFNMFSKCHPLSSQANTVPSLIDGLVGSNHNQSSCIHRCISLELHKENMTLEETRDNLFLELNHERSRTFDLHSENLILAQQNRMMMEFIYEKIIKNENTNKELEYQLQSLVDWLNFFTS